LRCGVLRISLANSVGIVVTKDAIEIALSAGLALEVQAALKDIRPFKKYNTVAEEADRLKLSQKTLRNLLKVKKAPHFVIGSDIRIDPVAMDQWLESRCSIRGPGPGP
jgi:excisionase family DNA binding protein